MNWWNNFWDELCKGVGKVFQDLKNFWFTGNPETGESPFIGNFIFATVVLLVGYFLIKLFLALLKKILQINKKNTKEKTVKKFAINSLKVFLYFGLFLIVLGILKVDLSGVAQIFSSAVLAIGLALQDVISNFASGIIILSSKPFVIGDYVNIGNGDCEGIVTDVKFLVTRIETVDKQIVTIPNKTITSSVIMNYTANPLRRLKIDIGVDYNTDIAKAKEVLINLAKSDNRVLAEPAPVCYVTEFQSSAINLSLRCYVPNDLYWDVLFTLNEQLIYEFNKNGISIPFNRLVISSVSKEAIEVQEVK